MPAGVGAACVQLGVKPRLLPLGAALRSGSAASVSAPLCASRRKPDAACPPALTSVDGAGSPTPSGPLPVDGEPLLGATVEWWPPQLPSRAAMTARAAQ